MNAPQVPTKLTPMQCLVKGRVEHASRWEGRTTTRIVTPAPDPYSKPQYVNVRSKVRLGQTGDEVEVLCKVGGYTRKAFRVTDKETGEVSMVTPVDVTLDAIE